MSKVDGDLIQSILWYAIAAIWALIAIARWLSRNLGCEYTDLDGCRIDPRNCPEYISCEDYHEQEEFYE